MSRSASDITLTSPVKFASTQPKSPPKSHVINTLGSPHKLVSGSLSIDQDLVDIETKLTDTRKSIDAKFYRSLANSPSPFFRQKQDLEPSEDLLQEDVFHDVSEEVPEKPIQKDVLACPEKRLNRSSLEHAFENPRELPDREFSDNSGFAVVDIPFSLKLPPVINSEPETVLRRRWSVNDNNQRFAAESCLTENASKSMSVETLSEKDTVTLLVKTKVRDASDIVTERNHKEELNREIVATKSQQTAKLETSSFLDKQPLLDSRKPRVQLFFNDSKSEFRSAPLSPKQSLIKAVDNAAKQKLVHNNANQRNLLDESLSETFSKIEATFSLKSLSPFTLDEKRKRRFSAKQRSRNFEPPESESSEDIDLDTKQRFSKSLKRPTSDEKNVYKSEAEENFEAAISEFQKSFSSMQQEKSSKTGSLDRNISSQNAPEIPIRMSQPISLVKHRLRQFKDSSESRPGGFKEKRSVSVPSKMRAEVKVSLTSLRPWTPPLTKLQPSSVIKDNVTQKLSKECGVNFKEKSIAESSDSITSSGTISVADSRLDGIHSLPCRRSKRLDSATYRAKARSGRHNLFL